MKEAWCLAASDAEASAREIMNSYAKRWTIEPGFRDTKDLRFGMGLSVLRIADPQRRDRLLLLNAFAIVLLTLLGAAGESLGMDRHLKVNTAKHRTHSLFRQGCMLYELIPNMPDVRLRPLVERFSEYITQNRALAQTFSPGQGSRRPHRLAALSDLAKWRDGRGDRRYQRLLARRSRRLRDRLLILVRVAAGRPAAPPTSRSRRPVHSPDPWWCRCVPSSRRR